MSLIGVEKLYYAKVLTDPAGGTPTFDAPKYLQGVKQIDIKPKVNTDKNYAENQLWEQNIAFDSADVSIALADLSNADRADLLGETIATEGGVFATQADKAPDVAILYVANKSNGKKRYGVIYKGKFTIPDENMKGMEGKTDFQNPSISATFGPLKSNSFWKYHVDEDDADASATLGTSWFTAVKIPTKKVVTP